MKNKYWKKQIPKTEGWFWFRYKGKRGVVVCPAEVYLMEDSFCVLTARNDVMTKHNVKTFGTFHFGDSIEMPMSSLNF